MQILMLASHPSARGPIPRIASLLATALEDRGIHVDAMPWGRHSEDESRAAKAFGRAGDLVRIQRTLSNGQFDAMLVHTAHDWATLARDIPLALLADRRGLPLVLIMHGTRPELFGRPGESAFTLASRALARLVDEVLVLSTVELSEWRRHFPDGSFSFATNPFVPDPGAAESSERRSRGCGSTVPVVLFVGRMLRAKGALDFVEAMSLVRALCPCHAVMAGDGPDAGQARERIVELGLTATVTLTGHIEPQAVHALYGSADLFAFPSRGPEGFPTVIAEALSAGLPIVTTPIRGVPDHLQDGVNALFAPPADPASFAQTVLRLLRDPGLQSRMSTANRLKVAEFLPDRVVGTYVRCLERAVTSRQA